MCAPDVARQTSKRYSKKNGPITASNVRQHQTFNFGLSRSCSTITCGFSLPQILQLWRCTLPEENATWLRKKIVIFVYAIAFQKWTLSVFWEVEYRLDLGQRKPTCYCRTWTWQPKVERLVLPDIGCCYRAIFLWVPLGCLSGHIRRTHWGLLIFGQFL